MPDREDTIKREKLVALLIRTGPLEEDSFETTLRIRAKLFDLNVPSYVLDENYRLLDWNPAFELTFPTDKFVRGEPVANFLKCLENYDEVLEKGEGVPRTRPSLSLRAICLHLATVQGGALHEIDVACHRSGDGRLHWMERRIECRRCRRTTPIRGGSTSGD